MAYFHHNDQQQTQKRNYFARETEPEEEFEDAYEEEYDDGLDDLSDDEEDEEEEGLTEEERQERRIRTFRMAFGIGNITAVIAGTVVILILLALILNMVGFVIDDVNRNFTLFQTRF